MLKHDSAVRLAFEDAIFCVMVIRTWNMSRIIHGINLVLIVACTQNESVHIVLNSLYGTTKKDLNCNRAVLRTDIKQSVPTVFQALSTVSRGDSSGQGEDGGDGECLHGGDRVFEGRRGGEDIIFLARRVISWKKPFHPLCGNTVDFIRLWMRKG